MAGMSTHAKASRAAQHKRVELKPWQLALAVAVIVAVSGILLAYGTAGSYVSLWHLAAEHHAPLPRLNPIGLDGGLIGIIVLDLVLTWAGHPLAWLRFAARAFAVGTLAANAAAGWPDPVAVFLRVFAPALIIVITEAVRSVLLDRVKEGRDPIPLARWFLAPRSTVRLWRRMVLWKVYDYTAAIDLELSRLQAIEKLTERFGKDWHKSAPRHVAWMLRSGVKMADALAEVEKLTAPAPAPEPLPDRVPARRSTARKSAPRAKRADDVTLEARALQLLATDLDMSGAELARQLGVSPGYGRKLRARLTAQDRPADRPSVGTR